MYSVDVWGEHVWVLAQFIGDNLAPHRSSEFVNVSVER